MPYAPEAMLPYMAEGSLQVWLRALRWAAPPGQHGQVPVIGTLEEMG